MSVKRCLHRSLFLDELRCQTRRGVSRSARSAITLVEVVVIIFIIVCLLALLLPATRSTREAARRNQCLNNFKQSTIAVQNYHDTRRSLPMASTSPLVSGDGIPQYGAVGAPSPSAESPTNWTAGQQGDGYSWIAQCLPFMEESALYEKMTTAQDAPVTRYGKLADAAFALSSNQELQAKGSATNPFFWSVKIPTLVCPSFPGEEDVAAFGSIPSTAGLKVAAGNYVALAATHYRLDPKNHLESGLPTAVGANGGGVDCAPGVPYCGNGGLPFPGTVDGKAQKTGLTIQSFVNGAARTAIITESREESLTSWYSGFASYVVAAMPLPNGGTPGGMRYAAGQEVLWSCIDIPNCDTALNKGSTKGDMAKYYQPISPHGGGARIWGPSSRHPGIVNHGYADGHVEGINDDIDKDVYLHLVCRLGHSGRDVTAEE